MKFAIITILSLAASAAKSCAKQSVIVAEKEGVVIAEKAGATAAKSGVRASEIAIARGASVSARYLAINMTKQSEYVTYDSTTQTFEISNIK